MKILIDLNRLKNDSGTYSENDVKVLEKGTGKAWQEIHKQASENEKPNVPEGNPAKWDTKTKLSFIDEHGRDEYKRLIDERK